MEKNSHDDHTYVGDPIALGQAIWGDNPASPLALSWMGLHSCRESLHAARFATLSVMLRLADSPSSGHRSWCSRSARPKNFYTD